MKTVEPAWHEFTVNYVYDEHDLQPYFGCYKRVEEGGGSQIAEFEIDGERWISKLYYQDSGIVNPGPETHTGTRFDIDEVREYRFAVARHPDEDELGEQSFNARLSPRWQGMQVKKKDGTIETLSIPSDLREGVNLRISGSNIDALRYEELLQHAAEAVGVNDWYFSSPNYDLSNVQDAERYVRGLKSCTGPIHARDGPIAQMSHLLENDRSGYRKVVQDDRDVNGDPLPGYYHTVTLGTDRVREAFPDHDFPREIKHYFWKHAKHRPKDDPLHHPKIGVSLQSSLWDGKIGADPESLRDLQRQLDQSLLSVLADAGLQIHAGDDDPFMPDSYFEPQNVDRDDDFLYALDLAQIRHDQKSVVIRYLVDSGLRPIQEDALARLVSDGGDVSPKEIAEETDWHPDSMRRALRDMEDLLEREYGSVAIRSPFIAEMLYEALSEARESIGKAVGLGSKLIEAAERGLDDTTSAFIAWASKHGIDGVTSERDARMKMRMGAVGSYQEMKRKLRQGYELWKDADRDLARFREATVVFELRGETQFARAGTELR